VHRVELASLRLREVHDTRGENPEPVCLEVREDAACLSGAKGIGLYDRQSTISRHFSIL
jgi:hypothetical protein